MEAMQIKQVVMVGKRQVELQTLSLDEKLGADEFLVRTECSFISAGTELAIYTAKEESALQKGSWCAYPWRAGYANVGVVEAVGPAVTRVASGQRVFSLGAHVSHFKCGQDAFVVAVPDGLEPGEAAASRLAGVATASMAMADRSKYQPVVLVFGLGMVGNLAAQAFRTLGAKVVGIDPLAARRELAGRCGLIRTFAGGETAGIKAELKRLTGVEQADICIDASGIMPVVLQALALTADVGQLILLGSPRSPLEGNITSAFSEIHCRNIAVRGALEWCLPAYPVQSIWGGRTPPLLSLWEKQGIIFDWISDGRLVIEPMISHRLPPTKIRDAYEGLLTAPETFTGVVLDWSAL
jgi:2-desacetyl-2-hydroxyethyl bacteriochlorophyllide A dehydrogenase